MVKSIKETFDEIQAFQAQNPEQVRSGCLYEQNADGQTLKDYIIKDQIFKNCSFYTTRFISCKFINCTFLKCNFSAAEMINTRFVDCTITECDFSDIILTDTNFNDCIKNNCRLDHIHRFGLSKGISNRDRNIIQDQDTETELVIENDEETEDSIESFIVNLKKLMTDKFPKWHIEQGTQVPSFALTTEDDKTGFVLYQDPEKNTTDSDNFWNISFVFDDEYLLTGDFNFFGKTDDEIASIIQNWITQVTVSNAETIVTRIVECLTK